MIPATIADIRQASPLVKVFTLETAEPMAFKAGQWLDFYVEIDGSVGIGGYSMTSSPLQRGSVEIAVKRSENPVAQHLHEAARVGDPVSIEGGQGNDYFEAGMADALILVAGGIGITPLMSIVRYAAEAAPDLPVTLLYSATTPDELVFRPEIDVIAARSPNLDVRYFVTRADAPQGMERGRITRDHLREVVRSDALHFVCGPPEMMDEFIATLGELGVPEQRIRAERWW